MKTELLKFYVTINKSNIKIVGTPQFEPYTDLRYGYDKETLIENFNLKPNCPIILFTCNDASSKNDPLYLRILADFIVKGKLGKEVNLIVRTSPAEEPTRFISIAESYPFIKWNFPNWKIERESFQEDWSQRVPTKKDVDDLKSLLTHCDININVLSTISLDSFIFDKPVINPVFGNKENEYFDDQKYLKYEHIKHLVDSNSSIIVKNKIDFLNAINNLLKFNDSRQKERQAFLKLEISKPIKDTSKRIAEYISEIKK